MTQSDTLTARHYESDDSLLAAVATTGAVGAFETLVGRFSSRVFALIVRITGSAPDAEELTQDVMMRVYERAAAFDGRSAVSTWIFRIAYNMAIDHTRRAARRPETPVDDFSADALPDDPDTDPRIAALDRALALLPPDDRALLTLYYYDSMSTTEIAGVMHLTQSNVKVRLMRLRQRLRDTINSLL